MISIFLLILGIVLWRRKPAWPAPCHFRLMNEIVNISPYSEKTARVTVYNPAIAAKYRPGHFVIVKFEKEGHRIPFSIISADTEAGNIDIIIHRADGLDAILAMIKVGEALPDMLGPLGNPAAIEPGKTILFFGDGAGVVPLLPLVGEARRLGCRVLAVLSEHSSRTQCLLGDIMKDADSIRTVADDELLENAYGVMDDAHVDKVIMSGPTLMMKRLARETERRNIPADCLLNMLMIDGIGLCGICRVIVGGERKQTCIDGPIFNAHLVDFDQMFNRQRLFV